MDLEEERQQIPVGRLLWIEHDLDRLRVSLVAAVGGVRDLAAGVPDPRRQDAGLPPEEILHSPKAPAGENRPLGFRAHADTSLLIWT